MKTSQMLLSFVIMLMVTTVYAQDPIKACPNVYQKVLLDNESVRVLEIEFEVGETAATHSHPNHFAYVTQGGQLTITGADGKAQAVDVNAGDVLWMDATTHSGKNTGNTVIKAIVTELKK